jgi:hypothetical protein
MEINNGLTYNVQAINGTTLARFNNESLSLIVSLNDVDHKHQFNL